MWLFAIRNGDGNSASLWNIPLWILTSTAVVHPSINSNLQFFHGVRDELYAFLGYLVHFETVHYPDFWGHIVCLFVVNPCHSYIFSSRFAPLEDVLINAEWITCSCPIETSFLFIGKDSVAYKRVVNLLRNLCFILFIICRDVISQ